MSFLEDYYPESKFGGFSDVDGTITFYSRINALTTNLSVVVDFGCGTGTYGLDPVDYRRQLRILKGKVSKVIGLDVDKDAQNNPYVDDFLLLTSPRWDLSDNTADVCIADSVLEHLKNPEIFFAECNRVIKPNGYLCIRTPNVLSYFGASKLIAHSHRASSLSFLRQKSEGPNPFPTYYRCNTISKLKQFMKNYDFHAAVYGYEAEPSYHDFSRVAYWLGYVHQKIIINRFKLTIFAFGKLDG
jgi:SAM-dependent methyltransferase